MGSEATLEAMEEAPTGARIRGQESMTTSPRAGYKVQSSGECPPPGGRVCRVEGRGHIVEGSCEATPMQEVVHSPQNAVLGDEGAPRFSPEEGVYGCMVV